jgi:protein phosphatase
LPTDIAQIVKDGFEANCETFTKLVGDATELICGEKGNIGNLTINERLVKIKPESEALVVGDLHGDLESLVDILKASDYLQKLEESTDKVLVFLGDYGDRGDCSAEVYYTVLNLKLHFPKQIVLMRGNHEGPEDLIAEPHDLPLQLQTRFGEKWTEAYASVRRLFGCLYNAALVEERYLLIHGGLSSHMRLIMDLAGAHVAHPKQRFLEDMLWSDPSDMIKETCASPRGAGKLFGEKLTDRILNRFDVKVLIRGHEPCPEGFKIDHNGKVLTLFSRKGPPYFNEYGAYLDVELSEKIENAEQLKPYIHKF